MSTFKCSREVYETARDIAETIRNEREHADPVDIDEWNLESVYAAAERECIYTQDNWDVVNLFRCGLDSLDVPPMSECDDIHSYMEVAAWYIWTDLIHEALNKES